MIAQLLRGMFLECIEKHAPLCTKCIAQAVHHGCNPSVKKKNDYMKETFLS